MVRFLSIVAFFSLFLISCSKSNTGPEAPVINILGMSTNTVRSGVIEDTLIISLKIADNNADLGNDENTGIPDVIMIDSRHTGLPEDTLRLYLPPIPNDIKDAGKGISGRGDIILSAGFYFFTRDSHPNGDTLHFDIQVLDRAGHRSNIVTTPDIYITP